MDHKTLTIVGYDKCPYIYQVCLFGAICKKRKRCTDYQITSFATRAEYTKWVKEFIQEHPQTHDIDITTSPFIHDEANQYFGGYSEMFALMQDVVIPTEKKCDTHC